MLGASITLSEAAAVGGTLLVGVGLAAEVIRRALDKLHKRIDDHMAVEEEDRGALRIELSNLRAETSGLREDVAYVAGRIGLPREGQQ